MSTMSPADPTTPGTSPNDTSPVIGSFYMSWVHGKCVQDCVGTFPCGGNAQSWDIIYDTLEICCDERNWYNKDCYTDKVITCCHCALMSTLSLWPNLTDLFSFFSNLAYVISNPCANTCSNKRASTYTLSHSWILVYLKAHVNKLIYNLLLI